MSDLNVSGPVALKCPQCGASLAPGADGYILCQHCGSSLVYAPPSPGGPAAGATVVRGMRLKPFTYTDAEGTGLPMFRMLAPVGWQLQGGCRWLLDNPGMPATVSFQLSNPSGAEAFAILPNMNFTWTDNAMARMSHPTGSRHFGAEVRKPVGIREALRDLVLPRTRSTYEGLRILSEAPLPDLPQQVRSEAPLSGGWAEGGKVRIRYTSQGRTFDEEIYGVVEAFRAPIATLLGPAEVVYWWVDYLFSFRAAADRLDATAGLFTVMISSFQLNPEWYAAYKSIVHQLAQMQIQRIRHIGQVGQIYAQTGREIREGNLQDWYARQAVYDRLDTDRSRAMRGVDAFYDPHREEVVELPSGYGQAWANNLGEYILTDSLDFNPNVYSNLRWEPMRAG